MLLTAIVAAAANNSLKINLGNLDILVMDQLTTGFLYVEAVPQKSFLVKNNFKIKSWAAILQTLQNCLQPNNLIYAVVLGK